jgi:hypothetical protein
MKKQNVIFLIFILFLYGCQLSEKSFIHNIYIKRFGYINIDTLKKGFEYKFSSDNKNFHDNLFLKRKQNFLFYTQKTVNNTNMNDTFTEFGKYKIDYYNLDTIFSFTLSKSPPYNEIINNELVLRIVKIGKCFFYNGKILKSVSKYNNEGKKNGLWKEYLPNRKLYYEIRYKNGDEFFLNSWDEKGNRQVINGNGEHVGNIDLLEVSLTESFFKNYKRDSIFVFKNNYGDTLKIDKYKEGKLVDSKLYIPHKDSL